jgi:hypothetical protein
MTRFCTRAAPVVVAMVSFLLLGCENKLTRDNYDRVQVGMSLMQVTDILGEGEKQEKGGASKLAQDMLGLELSGATARQNAHQAKQGLKDLTGPDGTTPQVATNTPTRVPSETQRVPVRDLWRTDKVEISVQFQDEKVVDKNQFGLD